MLFRSLGIVLLCSPSAALGGPDAAPYRLELVRGEGAASCSPATVVARDVVARLGRDPFAADGSRAFEVVFSRVQDTWQAMIYLRVDGAEGDAVRLIESDAPDCEELVQSVALAVALAIAPDAPPPPPPAVAPRPPEPAPARQAPAPRPSPTTPLHAGFSLRALASPNLLPSPAAGGAVAATLRVGRLVGASMGALFFPESELSAPQAGLGFGVTAAFISGCLWAKVTDPQVFSCIGSRVGALHTVVYRPEPEEPGDRWWWALSSELALRQRLFGGAFIEAGVAAVFPLIRYRFQAGTERAVVYQQGPAAAEAFVGLGLRLD